MREGGVTCSTRDSARARPSRRLAFLASCFAIVVLAVGGNELGPASASSLPEPSDGGDVRVNTPGDPDEQGPECNIQSEVSIAAWGDTVVAGWNDSSQCRRLLLRRVGQDDGVGVSLSGFGYSLEGGREGTWVDGGLLDAPEGGRLFGDPVLAAGPGGVFYYATLYACVTAPCQGPRKTLQIGVARSVDGGTSWTVPVDVSHFRGDASTVYHDKPWVAVDTTGSPDEQGDVYVAWTELTKDGGDSVAVLFSRSEDDGKTFSEPVKPSVPVTEDEDLDEYPGMGTQVVAGPDGEVYVAWLQTTVDKNIWVARSTNGGDTFDPPTFVAEPGRVGHDYTEAPHCGPAGSQDPQAILENAPGWIDPNDPLKLLGATTVLPAQRRLVINGDIRIGNWLSMAVDASGSSDPASPQYNPHRGTLYLAVPHDPDPLGSESPLNRPQAYLTNAPAPYGDESDIAFMYSEDRGATWSNIAFDEVRKEWVPNFIVNDDFIVPGTDERTRTDQFHPQVVVDSAGRVAVSWYDRRSDPWNLDMEMYAAVSTDGGRTFGENFPVSDQAFPPARTNPNTGGFDGCYMGEYNGMIGGEDGFLLAWGDNRDGPGVHPDPNIYFDRITFDDTPYRV